MRRIWLMVLCGLLLTAGVRTGFAEESAPLSPVMLSLVNPVQLPPDDWDVGGMRLNILYGKSRNVYGLDVGFVNHTTGREIGLDIGVVNYVEKEFLGFQIGVVNIAQRVAAFQLGVFNSSDSGNGLQIGLINHTRIAVGCQVGLINVIENSDIPFLPVINWYF